MRYRSGHIPAAFPKIYTEESIVAECQKLWPDFIKAENYIADHQELNVEQITEDHIRGIIVDYIKKQCGNSLIF